MNASDEDRGLNRQERAGLVGALLVASDRKRVGRVEAEFADYVLVRTAGLLPVDLYIPRPEIADDGGSLRVTCTRGEARHRWHRPLKRAPHT